MHAPQPRMNGNADDTFFIGPPAKETTEQLDIRDPRSRHLFRVADSDIELESLRVGARVDAPTVSASMATALLAYSGIAVKMLVDQRLDAQLSTMFLVEYQPGEWRIPTTILSKSPISCSKGRLKPSRMARSTCCARGDIMWTGVGCVHAFYNKSNRTVRWLETQSPQPPARHSYRFNRDWEYLKEKLAASSLAVAHPRRAAGSAR